MKCLSCNIGELDLFGEPSKIINGYCVKNCRKVMEYATQIINRLNELYPNMDKLQETEDPFCSYDAMNDTYIVEIKSRDNIKDSWIIEKKKFDSNIIKAIEENKSFIYLTECNGKVMTWNINRM